MSTQQVQEAKILEEKVNAILLSVGNLAKNAAVIAFLGDKANAIVANEFAAVKAILTTPCKTNNERAGQISKIQCTPESWANLVMSAIQIGVTLNPFSKQAAVIPYGVTVSLDIMVAGYKHLLFSNNIVKAINSNAICKGDEFSMIQPLLKETVSQNFKFVKAMQERGDYIGGFCFFVLSNGEYLGDYLPRQEIDKRRKVAKTQMVWDAWELEMVEKTVLKYVMKNLPTFTSLPVYGMITQVEEQHIELSNANLPQATLQVEAAKPIMDLQNPLFAACRAAVQRGDRTIEKLREKHIVSDESARLLLLPELDEKHENWQQAKMAVQTSKRTIEQMRETFFITDANVEKLKFDAI